MKPRITLSGQRKKNETAYNPFRAKLKNETAYNPFRAMKPRITLSGQTIKILLFDVIDTLLSNKNMSSRSLSGIAHPTASSGTDTMEDIVKENEYLRHQLEDMKQDAFVNAHSLNEKLVEVMEENECLKRSLKDTIASQEGSHEMSLAERCELEQTKREIRSLRLELVYLKHEARQHSITSQFSSNASLLSEASSEPSDSMTVNIEADALRREVQRLEKELQFSRITASNLRQQLLSYVTSDCASGTKSCYKGWAERSTRSPPEHERNTNKETRKSAEGLSFLSSPYANKHIRSKAKSTTLPLQNAPDAEYKNTSPRVSRSSVKQHGSAKHHKRRSPTKSSNICSHHTPSIAELPKELNDNSIHQKQENPHKKTSFCKIQATCANTADKTYKPPEKPKSKRTSSASARTA